MSPQEMFLNQLSRRAFIKRGAGGIGAAALMTLLNPNLVNGAPTTAPTGPMALPGMLGHTHFAPKAKRIIYLCQSGAPPQLVLFDYKPQLDKLRGSELP